MTLETVIPGDAEEVERLARWLRDHIGDAVSSGAEALVAVRRQVESDWDGRTGSALEATFGSAVPKVDDLAEDIAHCARELFAYAEALSGAQGRMAQIRARASGSGLTVEGTRILVPTSAHLLDVFQGLATEAETVRRALQAAVEALVDQYATRVQTVLTVKDIAGSFAAGGTLLAASRLRSYSMTMQNQAVANLTRLRVPPGRGGMAKFRDEVRRNARAYNAADPHRVRADGLSRKASPSLGKALKGGAPLAILGIGLDIAGGKDPVQATVSGGAGFAASVGAGALTGAAIGSVVPVAGTAVGAVVGGLIGVGVGIFASGATDSVFENGPDVGAAWNSGVQAIEDFGGDLYDLFHGTP